LPAALFNYSTFLIVKFMKLNKFLTAFIYNTIVGLLFAVFFSVNIFIAIGIVMAAGAIMYKTNAKNQIAFFDGLAQEIWVPDVMNLFYPDSSFLSQPMDMSSFVDADAINLADAGLDPDVLVDNTIYPVPETDASDKPLRLILKTYDTTSTVVRNAVALELAYDQRQLYTKKHQLALRQKLSIDAAYAYAPPVNSQFNPAIDATADNANVILDRIIELQLAYNAVDAPLEGRVLVLDPAHAAIIAKEDKLLYKTFENTPGSTLFGFKIYGFSKNPIYQKATMTKAAQGTAYVAANHAKSSFAFLKGEVMKAQGTMKLFSFLNSPAHKGDVFNFQMRALATSHRNKYMGAIIK